MEINLLLVREVSVYSLPPRSATGYRAQEWENSLIWKGRLRIVTFKPDGIKANTNDNDSKLYIRLEEADGRLFAQCDYAPVTVEPVVDSSRYFVMKITDINTHKHAFIGIGFAERAEAFDFNVTLQDWVKRNDPKEQQKKKAIADPAVDYSLKEGQTISINLKVSSKKIEGPINSDDNGWSDFATAQ